MIDINVITAHGRKYGYSAQNTPENAPGKRSCGLSSQPPAKALMMAYENDKSPINMNSVDLPKRTASRPWDMQQCKGVGAIGMVRYVSNHAFDDPYVCIN